MNELPYFIQITDKWSKRRFALRLKSAVEFSSLSTLLDYIQQLSDEDIEGLISDGRLSEAGRDDIEDFRAIAYNIDERGNFTDLIEEIVFKQRGRMLQLDKGLKFEHRKTDKKGYADIFVAELILDRDNVPYKRNWKGYYKRKWDNNPSYKRFVENLIHEKYPERGDDVLQIATYGDAADFLRAIGERLHSAPYELYSRFIGRNLRFRTGPEALDTIISGRGGNCSEKAAAFLFIAQNWGIESRFALAGDGAKGEFPYDTLRRALDNFDFRFKEDTQRYWSHFANIFVVDGKTLLVDATGGPIEFIFAEGKESVAYLTRSQFLPVSFPGEDEAYYYHDAPQDIAEDVLYTMEAFIPDTDLYHVFGPDDEDAPFGLLIKDNLWVCPGVYRTEGERNDEITGWRKWAQGTERVAHMEIYDDLDASPEKEILTRLEEKSPHLVADLRLAEDFFIERCRQSWRDSKWKAIYVFVDCAGEK